MTIQEMMQELDNLNAEGWMSYISSIDYNVVKTFPCETCGSEMEAVGRVKDIKHVSTGYRCWAFCEQCDEAGEF